jgi:trehalose-6-phosphate synthase
LRAKSHRCPEHNLQRTREQQKKAPSSRPWFASPNICSRPLLVNPYDVSQLAESIHRALEMPEEEQARRMQRMRHTVREHNIYRWAANLLSDLTEIRVELTERMEAPQAT